MDSKFLTLPLLSESFTDKLQTISNSDSDLIAKHILEASNIIKTYNRVGTICEAESLREKFRECILDTLKNYITDFGRQLTLKSDEYMVSFLPKGCEPVYNSNGSWNKKNRQSGKPGKIIQKLIGEGKFKQGDYEQFVYRLKALWQYNGYELKLVSGEDIRFWYNCNNYYERVNTLGHSCMSHPDCANYFDVYVEQPECQMLIALKEGKLAARALV